MAVTWVGVSLVLPVAAYAETPSPGQTAPPATPAQPAPRAPIASPEKCERYVSVLAGREKDPALLKQADVKALAARAPQLVTCGAVLTDSDDTCKVLPKEAAEDCTRTRMQFHELRAHPNSRSFMFDDRKYEECKQNRSMVPVCEALRNAFRSGDASRCVMQADFVAICRTQKDIDTSKCSTEAPRIKDLLEGQCRAMVNLDESGCDIPGPHEAEMAKQCRDAINAKKIYGKGLQELASSGSAREKDLAKAALDDPDACKTSTEPAMDACLGKASAAAPSAGGTTRSTISSPPATTPPKQPAAPPKQ